MFTDDHYVPILKWKRGEYKALEALDSTARASFTPLIEVQPVPWDYKNDTWKKSTKEHLEDLAEQLEGSWGTDRAFLDLELVDPSVAKLPRGVHPVEWVFDAVRATGAQLVPVTGLDRDAAYQKAVAAAAKADGLGACLRLRRTAIFDDQLQASVDALLNTLKVTPRDVDLVCDLRELNEDEYALVQKYLLGVLNALPYLGTWRTFTVAGSALPASLSALGRGIGTVPRREWELWQALAQAAELQRKPTFGDYGVAHWDKLDENPAFLKITANIRYTSTDVWVVARGLPLRPHGYDQYHGLAKAITKHPSFNHACCPSETQIIACAARKATSGSPETWLRTATHHHVMHVIQQIASLP
jgi:hypothetical protein